MIDWRWLAGFVDGDGTIGVWSNHVGKAPGFTARMSIYNTYKPLLIKIAKELDGRLNETSFTPGRQKPCYMVTWTGDNAKRILTKILPFLQIKAEVAKLALACPKRRRLGRGKIDIKNLKKQLLIADKVHKLNKRGI